VLVLVLGTEEASLGYCRVANCTVQYRHRHYSTHYTGTDTGTPDTAAGVGSLWPCGPLRSPRPLRSSWCLSRSPAVPSGPRGVSVPSGPFGVPPYSPACPPVPLVSLGSYSAILYYTTLQRYCTILKKLTFFGRRFKSPNFVWIENEPSRSRWARFWRVHKKSLSCPIQPYQDRVSANDFFEVFPVRSLSEAGPYRTSDFLNLTFRGKWKRAWWCYCVHGVEGPCTTQRAEWTGVGCASKGHCELGLAFSWIWPTKLFLCVCGP
jgi:hypothetical protein